MESKTVFLKEIKWFTYYVKAPLRGLLKEIPENHLFHLWLETPACILHLTQLSRLKQQNWKELYIRFQLTVSILYKSFFLLFSYGLQPTIIWLSHVRWSVHPSVRPSGNVLMLRHVHAYLYVRPAKDLVMGLSAHDQTFASRVILMVIIWPYRFKKQAGAELYLIMTKIARVGTWMGDPSYIADG